MNTPDPDGAPSPFTSMTEALLGKEQADLQRQSAAAANAAAQAVMATVIQRKKTLNALLSVALIVSFVVGVALCVAAWRWALA